MADAAAVAVLAPLVRVEVATAVVLAAAAARHTAHGRRAAPSTHAHPPPQPTRNPPATELVRDHMQPRAHARRRRMGCGLGTAGRLARAASSGGSYPATVGLATVRAVVLPLRSSLPSLRSPRACCCSPPGECNVLKDEAEPLQRTLVPMSFQAAVDRHSPPAGRRHDGRRRRYVGPGHGPAAASRLPVSSVGQPTSRL